MQALSTIGTSSELQVREATHDTPSALLAERRAVEAAEAAKGERTLRPIEAAPVADSRFRLGDLVRHGRYGAGRVQAHWPDGTVLVRFDRVGRNRLVWPSFLESASG